jgi:glucose/arabinose dehydrogenase
VDGLVKPVNLAHAGDGSGRLFVIEQDGLIRIIQEGALSPVPFLDIRDRVGSQGFEQGLLGLAFHPDYSKNGFFFVNYTDFQGDTVIARFRVSDQDSNLADPSTETRLLFIQQPYPNHNGGMVAFGPDGYLYLGLGDGGSAGDPLGNGQSLASLLGKILRLDVNSGELYAWPPDNPFSLTGGGLPEIWAYGLRNPWRFAFDRLTGDLYIGDVGQNQWEEIDFLPAGNPGGANFGWNYLEGSHPYAGIIPGDLNLAAPIAEYSHQFGCSVTGGVVYRGSLLADWQGVYLFGDYCSGRLWGLVRDSQRIWVQAVLFEGLGSISSFGEDESGEVYLVNHAGSIWTLTAK